MTIYNQILTDKTNGRQLLAILIDPEKTTVAAIAGLSIKINNSPATHIFVGGSSFDGNHLDELIVELKKHLTIPVLLFPGNPTQISNQADGILFLSLISGRNPDYLIDYQVRAVPILQQSTLEIIPTGYILIDGGTETAVQRVSKTQPIDRHSIDIALNTALAGVYLGQKLIYLEAGSGAQESVPFEMVERIANHISIPLIVGGGIRSQSKIEAMYKAGAAMVVIGTAFENDSNFFEK